MSATAGVQRSFLIRHRTPVIAIAIVFYVAGEVVLRSLWAASTTSRNTIIAVYHVFILVATLLCTVAFALLTGKCSPSLAPNFLFFTSLSALRFSVAVPPVER